MKRDWNLVREILLAVGNSKPLPCSDDNDEASYHIALLLESHIEWGSEGLVLTLRGKKLFDAIQNKEAFDRAVGKIESCGIGVSEPILLKILANPDREFSKEWILEKAFESLVVFA